MEKSFPLCYADFVSLTLSLFDLHFLRAHFSTIVLPDLREACLYLFCLLLFAQFFYRYLRFVFYILVISRLGASSQKILIRILFIYFYISLFFVLLYVLLTYYVTCTPGALPAQDKTHIITRSLTLRVAVSSPSLPRVSSVARAFSRRNPSTVRDRVVTDITRRDPLSVDATDAGLSAAPGTKSGTRERAAEVASLLFKMENSPVKTIAEGWGRGTTTCAPPLVSDTLMT